MRHGFVLGPRPNRVHVYAGVLETRPRLPLLVWNRLPEASAGLNVKNSHSSWGLDVGQYGSAREGFATRSASRSAMYLNLHPNSGQLLHWGIYRRSAAAMLPDCSDY